MLTFIEICLLLMMGACLCALVFYIFRDMAKDRKAKQEWQEAEQRRRRRQEAAQEKNRNEIARSLGKL